MNDSMASSGSENGPIRNVATLIRRRAEEFPNLQIGTVNGTAALSDIYRLAGSAAEAFRRAGLKPGQCAAMIGETSPSYMITWIALQLAGVQAAPLNPNYPVELLAKMAADLEADAIVWIGRAVDPAIPSACNFDSSDLADGILKDNAGNRLPLPEPPEVLPGLLADQKSICSYMHTSGTTGRPKFCALSHEYFLRLGRFIADEFGMTPNDTVFAPMPMFHLNPLGYGLVGSLTGGSSILGWEKFSARNFWKSVKDAGITILMLHIPPVEILKKATAAGDAAGHKVRISFCGDPDFLRKFGVPQGVTCYGSTEGGGMTHTWHARADDTRRIPEGEIRYAGRCRYDVDWKLGPDNEIFLREKGGSALLSGYRRNGVIESPFDAEGWFHTGDLGRADEWGNLIFVERAAESIRVKGEYVPVDYIEKRLVAVPGLDEFAIWRRNADVGGHEVVIYTTAENAPANAIMEAVRDLPVFMKPVAVVSISNMPRDTGVGKVQRRLLEQQPPRAVIELSHSS